MTQVKICGIRRIEDAVAAVEAGADMLGFVFAESPRRVEPEEVRAIVSEVRRLGDVITVGVFVNETPDRMNEVRDFCGLDWVQLSGHEPESDVRRLTAPSIKGVHVDREENPDGLAARLEELSSEVVLLDAKHDVLFGGSGTAFDWTVVPKTGKRVLLAGGLNEGNVGDAIRIAQPWGVDVSSGVETGGWKDPAKIRSFIEMVRAVG